MHRLIVILSSLVLAAAAQAGGSEASKPNLDDGLLDPAWFSSETLEFRQSGKIDFLWVREGFAFDGRTLQFVPWDEPVLLPERDDKDRKAASKFQKDFSPRLILELTERLSGKATVVADDPDLRAYGRIVDCNAGNAFAFVWPHFTFDMKFVDREGNLQAAVHTRFVGKALKINYGTWAGWVAEPFGKGIAEAWRSGKPIPAVP